MEEDILRMQRTFPVKSAINNKSKPSAINNKSKPSAINNKSKPKTRSWKRDSKKYQSISNEYDGDNRSNDGIDEMKLKRQPK